MLCKVLPEFSSTCTIWLSELQMSTSIYCNNNKSTQPTQIRKSQGLPKFSGNFPVQRYIYDKIFIRILSLFQRYEPNCGIMSYLTMLKNPSKNSSTPRYQDVDDSCSMSTDTSLVEFLWTYLIRSFYVKLLINRKTNRRKKFVKVSK